MNKYSRQIRAAAIVPGHKYGDFSRLIENQLAVCFKGFFGKRDTEKTVKSVYAASPDWSAGFEGVQYVLGEAWYHYAEEGRSFEEYSAKSKSARATVEKHVPGLEKKIIGFLSSIAAPHTVSIRKGWAGPGIMIFPAGGHVAEKGGSVHFDLDAFTQEELKNPDLQLLSFICMLQKPASGGNLTIWRRSYDRTISREENFFPDASGFDNTTIEYQPGDLWMLNGLSAHQITPFQGDTDRICLTFHIYRDKKKWHLWF